MHKSRAASLQPRMRPRAILTEAQAREIFAQRGRLPSATLSEKFDISQKAVRDIWNGRLSVAWER